MPYSTLTVRCAITRTISIPVLEVNLNVEYYCPRKYGFAINGRKLVRWPIPHRSLRKKIHVSPFQFGLRTIILRDQTLLRV